MFAVYIILYLIFNIPHMYYGTNVSNVSNVSNVVEVVAGCRPSFLLLCIQSDTIRLKA